jgi:hypothetical protein
MKDFLKVVGRDDWALFVGHWPTAFLLMGGRGTILGNPTANFVLREHSFH